MRNNGREIYSGRMRAGDRLIFGTSKSVDNQLDKIVMRTAGVHLFNHNDMQSVASVTWRNPYAKNLNMSEEGLISVEGQWSNPTCGQQLVHVSH